MKKFFRFLAFVPMLFPLSLHAQGIGEDVGFKLPGYMDNVVPPSPTAAQIVKYADTPVSYSLGLADITIPIYTIKTRELELPITLTYHASGIRVDEIPGPVGLGWSLNAGGAITKTVVGLADHDATRPYFRSHRIYNRDQLDPDCALGPYLPTHEMIDYLDGVIKNRHDSYYDRYNYSYNGNSGSFMLVHAGYSGDSQNYEVKKTTPNDDIINFYGDDYATILDPYGNKYRFNATENVELVTEGMTNDMTNWLYGYNTISSWHLTQIESYSGLDRITLNYWDEDVEWTKRMLSHSRPYSRNIGVGVMDRWGESASSPASSRMTYSNMKLIESIAFEGGSVEFEYGRSSTRRIGGYLPSLHPENYNIPYRLSKITIIEDGVTVKVFNMTYDQSGFGDGRTMLTGINVEKPNTTGGDTLYDSYTFDYYDKDAAPAYYAQDMFGYYNGKNGNPNLCHMVLFPVFDPNGVESQRRMYSVDHAVVYTLSEVVTRRGSSEKTKTRYEYEANRHVYDANAFEGLYSGDIISEVNIGVRIRSIETYDGNICVKRRVFEYEESDCTIDFSQIRRSHYFTRSQHYTGGGPFPWSVTVEAEQFITFSNSSVLPGATPESAKIYYNRVNEYISDGRNSADKVRVEYLYDCDDSKAEQIYIDPSWSHPYNVHGHSCANPNEIAIVLTQNLEDNFKWWTYIIIPYSLSADRGPDDVVHAQEIQFYFKGNTPTFNNLKRKIVYKTEGNDYVKVEEEINEYRKFNSETVFTGLYVKDLMSSGMLSGQASEFVGGGMWVERPAGAKVIKMLPNDCYYFDVEEEVSVWKLVSSKRIKYFDGDIPVSDTVPIGDGVYNPEFGGLNGSGPIGSGSDYFELIDDGYTLNPFLRPSKTETTQYGYHMESASVLSSFQPKYVTQHVDGDVYRREYKYPSDFASNGNVYAEMDEANNHYTVVEESVSKGAAGDMAALADRISIRTYFKKLDVDSIGLHAIKPYSRTRSVNNVQTHAYTIHNHDRYGNPACVSVNGMAPTCYIWSYGGKHLVAEIKNATYAELTAKITQGDLNTITADMNPSEHMARLNSLRTSLPGAMVTVYEYKPMVGISAITDPSGRKTTFSYDAAGRLSTVKDPDGNLIETYEYKNF